MSAAHIEFGIVQKFQLVAFFVNRLDNRVFPVVYQ